MLDTFWRKWQKEYLSRYDVNNKWTKKHENKLNVGDVVVIVEPEKFNKRSDWKLGKVVEPTFASQTGRLSGAKLRLATGHVVTRHLRQLALLEAATAFRGREIPADNENDVNMQPATTTAKAGTSAGGCSTRRPQSEGQRPAVGADPGQEGASGVRSKLEKGPDDRSRPTNVAVDRSDMSDDENDDINADDNNVERPSELAGHAYNLRKRTLKRGKRSYKKKKNT